MAEALSSLPRFVSYQQCPCNTESIPKRPTADGGVRGVGAEVPLGVPGRASGEEQEQEDQNAHGTVMADVRLTSLIGALFLAQSTSRS